MGTRHASRRSSEDGSVAILYSVAMLMMLGLLALTIDAGALRYDRRHTQSVADMAATAGALALHEFAGGDPQQACETAWAYVLQNIGEDEVVDPCVNRATGLPTFPASRNPCPSTPIEGVGATQNYGTHIFWPVPQGDLLDGRYDAALDGDDPCERIAVVVFRTRGFVFAGGVNGGTQGSTGAPAVARATIEQHQEQAVALVVLDPHGCQTLLAKGGGANVGGVWVWEAPGGNPGIITVDSDGEECGGYVIDRGGGGGAPAEIKAGVADATGTIGNGEMLSYALHAGDCGGAGGSDCAYDDADTSDGAVQPVPVAGQRATRAPVDHRYDCKDDYEFVAVTHAAIDDCPGDERVPAGSQYITELKSEVLGAVASPEDAGFEIYGDDPATEPCTIGGGHPAFTELELPPDRQGWWIRCPTFDIKSGYTIAIPEGNVVFEGSVALNGKLLINADQTDASVSTLDSDGQVDRSEDNWVAIISGTLTKRGGSSVLHLGRADPVDDDGGRGTMVLAIDAHIDFAGTSDDLKWFAPYVGAFEYSAGCTPAVKTTTGCNGTDYDLEDLSLWSESLATHKLAGGVDNLRVEGVFFTPNAEFEYAGNGEMGQQKAQFITYTMYAHGNGKLHMVPDPDRAVKFPLYSVSLIR